MTNKDLNPNKVDFPCGKCGKACMEMANLKDPQFEDHSVGCDKCEKWYHLFCVDLDGTAEYVQENSNLEYYCPNCIKKHPQLQKVMNKYSKRNKCKGKGKG